MRTITSVYNVIPSGYVTESTFYAESATRSKTFAV